MCNLYRYVGPVNIIICMLYYNNYAFCVLIVQMSLSHVSVCHILSLKYCLPLYSSSVMSSSYSSLSLFSHVISSTPFVPPTCTTYHYGRLYQLYLEMPVIYSIIYCVMADFTDHIWRLDVFCTCTWSIAPNYSIVWGSLRLAPIIPSTALSLA